MMCRTMVGHHTDRNKQKTALRGFTIVEILIVVAVLAIRAVGGMVPYGGMYRTPSSAVSADSIKSATDIVLREEVSKRGIPDSIDAMFSSHPDVAVRFTRIVAPGGLPY